MIAAIIAVYRYNMSNMSNMSNPILETRIRAAIEQVCSGSRPGIALVLAHKDSGKSSIVRKLTKEISNDSYILEFNNINNSNYLNDIIIQEISMNCCKQRAIAVTDCFPKVSPKERVLLVLDNVEKLKDVKDFDTAFGNLAISCVNDPRNLGIIVLCYDTLIAERILCQNSGSKIYSID